MATVYHPGCQCKACQLIEAYKTDPPRFGLEELLALFNRSLDDSRWLSCANSQEDLSVLIYLVARNKAEK